MSTHINLSPGTPAPETGDYKCLMCAMQATMRGDRSVGSIASNVFGSGGGTVMHFESGDELTKCPLCGDMTGWTLLNQETIAFSRQEAGDGSNQQALARPWWKFWR